MRTPPGFAPWLPALAAALTAGTALSTAVATRRQQRRGVPRALALRRAAGWSGAGASTLGILAVTLTPAEGVQIGVSLVPLAGTTEVLRISGDPRVVARIVGLNILLFVPLGLSVALLLDRRRVLGATLVGAALSILVEAGQLVLPVARSTDVDDVLLNTAGAALGAAAATALRRRLE